MRKMNKLVAISILAAVATLSMPQAFAGIMLTDRTNQVTANNTGVVMGDFTGVVMGDFTGILLTDLAYAITGVVMGD